MVIVVVVSWERLVEMTMLVIMIGGAVTSQTCKMGGNCLRDLLLDVVSTSVMMLLMVSDLDRMLIVARIRPRLRRVYRMCRIPNRVRMLMSMRKVFLGLIVGVYKVTPMMMVRMGFNNKFLSNIMFFPSNMLVGMNSLRRFMSASSMRLLHNLDMRTRPGPIMMILNAVDDLSRNRGTTAMTMMTMMLMLV